ncbi:MAG: hypothetical protein QNL32_00795 [Actinomycetes bacterium]
MENTSTSHSQIEEIKVRISEVKSKAVDSHSLEFESIHADLSRVLSEVDGL